MSDLNAALEMIRRGQCDKALEALGLCADSPESRAEALGHRAWLCRSLGRLDEALRDYEALVAERPDDLEAAARKAETRLLAGQIEEAAAEAVQVLQRDPFHALAARVLADCHEGLGRGMQTLADTAEPGKSVPWRPVNPVVEALESDPDSYPASVFQEIGRFLYAFVRLYRPRLALETGSYIGYSALCIGQALEDNGAGRLHSFDLFLNKPDYTSPVVGSRSDMLEVARAHIEKAGLSRRVTFHKGDSSKSILSLFGAKETKFDFAFIDGDHTLRGCLKDWHAVDGLMAEGGVVLLHDTMPEKCGWLGPRYLLEELAKHAPGRYHWLNIPSPDGCGLGLIQKKTAGESPKWRPTLGELAAEKFFHRR